MSNINNDFFKAQPSDMLLNMAKDALREAGNYPHLEEILNSSVKPDTPSLSDQFNDMQKGVF